MRRGATQRFAPGFTAFPGGRRDPEDAAVPVAAPGANDPGDVACAARELFEEVGVLVATGAAPARAAALAEPAPACWPAARLRRPAARATASRWTAPASRTPAAG